MPRGDQHGSCDAELHPALQRDIVGVERHRRVVDQFQVRVTGEGAKCLGESPCEVTLALALARQDRMDLAVRQAVELGAAGIVAFRAARSQYGLSGAALEKRRERFSAIAREALSQCGRSRLPEIAILPDFSGFPAFSGAWAAKGEGLLLAAMEGSGGGGLPALFREHPGARRVLAVVGPEGGFTQIETGALRGAGFFAVTLGPRVLRCETAAAALLASIQMLRGDAGGEERC